MITAVDCSILRLNKDFINPEFFNYYSQSNKYLDEIENKCTGATRKRISRKNLGTVQILLPSLPEQKRIVAILDEAFAGISQAVANAEKNLANARELFDSYLNEVFTRKGEGWIEVYLEDVLIEPLRNGWSPPAKNHSDEGTPVLTLSSVTGFKFDPTKRKFTSALINKNAHYWANHGDLLMTRSNTPMLVGHVAICEGLQEPTIYPDLIMKLKINGEKALTSFVYYQLRSQKLRELIMERAQGANPTMKKINKESTQSLPISLPAIELQKNIVTKLDRLLQEANELESVYQRKLAALVELKQAILQKAFTGELTAQKSPLDVDGVSLDVQREELVAVVREGRERD